MSDADSKKNRVADAVQQAEQELAEKGPNQAMRDDMAELKEGIKKALSRDDRGGPSQEAEASQDDAPTTPG